MRVQRNTYHQMAALVLVFAVLALAAIPLEASANTIMPYRYRNTVNGATYTGGVLFYGVTYSTTGTYCADDHRDPDGNKYVHSHLPHHFSFDHFNQTTQQVDSVSATKSDWAWNAYYVGYSLDEDNKSTFVKNCFAYAVGAPYAMPNISYMAFTQAATLSQATSIATTGHAIKVTMRHVPGCDPAYEVSHSIEKNASSGVYSKSWSGASNISGWLLRKAK